jgi:hypothetical protein
MQKETSPGDVSLRLTSPVEVTAAEGLKGGENGGAKRRHFHPHLKKSNIVMSNDRRE